ncbi:uncharacterized protein C8Q71DRAFT_794554 [Rhodofomes roseus]|uniref:Uncharacterized protein n=1 Tax=Rhodofomes roseus TaxID=34475 RepID=A0ABQ8KS65_9APHY|nr:uncharacterized protein C8Q71DRAFT_794554 [Rhodofomes roseus]KAH9841645.1 hypothetical protein C8Q71DRAFT_794554 [Rhodofomes roseus]
MDEDTVSEGSVNFLDTVEGEIAFFRSMMRARPVGLHRHFHVLTIRNAILKDTGHVVSTEALWGKLRSSYDLDILEGIEADGYDASDIHDAPSPSSLPVRSPSPSENLSMHPFFRHEYSLPQEETFDRLISARRMRGSASLPSSSPAASPVHTGPSLRSTKKGRSKLKNMAGLIGGDSDSSALTQESGDESVAATPRDSVAAGTDAGTDFAEEEEVDGSPSPSLASRANRKPVKPGRRGSNAGRGRGGSTGRGRGSKRGKR